MKYIPQVAEEIDKNYYFLCTKQHKASTSCFLCLTVQSDNKNSKKSGKALQGMWQYCQFHVIVVKKKKCFDVIVDIWQFTGKPCSCFLSCREVETTVTIRIMCAHHPLCAAHL